MNLTLSSLAYPVTALGPGRRLALWVAGCRLRCQGCISPELWIRGAGKAVAVERVRQRILALSAPIDGITLTGGEPFDQAAALARLLEALTAERPAWNVVLFSGYRLADLARRGEETLRLLACTDVLVAGPYVQRRPAVHPLAGSGNQVVHYLTARGETLRPAIESLPFNRANFALGPDGRQLLIGILQPEARRTIHEQLGIAPNARRPPA